MVTSMQNQNKITLYMDILIQGLNKNYITLIVFILNL